MTRNIIISFILLQNFLFAQAQTKIIDMHIHSYSQSEFGVREPASDSYGKKGAASAEIHRAETFTAFKKWNIVKAMVSGNPDTGGGDPGGTYSWSPKARLKMGDPYLIEDVLIRYPKLRIYLMHNGGEEWHEHALRLMAYYPQLYTDIAVMLWVEPNSQRTVTQFLKNAKHAGYLNRVMFGSDQMVWPYAIEKSIKFLNSLTFLTKQDKEDIFYNNAVKFLKLTTK